MIEAPEIELVYSLTDGNIAVNNLESARQRSWSRLWHDPLGPSIAECIVEQEQLTAHFVGDPGALDRLDTLIKHLDRLGQESPRTTLTRAQIASLGHRFAEARRYLDEVGDWGGLSDAANRLRLSIAQACGIDPEAVLETRQQMAAKSGRLEDFVPLAALHADLREFDEADRIYQSALREYRDTSPFAVAWVCFQLGVLWGELVPEAQSSRAQVWYQKAIEYLPCYAKARVHLAEIYLKDGGAEEAEALLIAAIPSGDPEVHWRLADVLVAMRRTAEAEDQLEVARSGFEALLSKHLLAFADHGAEFYSSSGENPKRAFELAEINLANRPTLHAFEQAYAAANEAGEIEAAYELTVAARKRWGATRAFRLSPLATPARGPAEGQIR
jgi:tetratricopeptide (TPR) repeat protein